MNKQIRVGIFVTHPVQYHVPIWQELAQDQSLDIKVHYLSDHSIRGEIDPGFGVSVSWDTPMLEGYQHEFIKRDCDINRPRTFFIPHLYKRLKQERFDWILIAGYTYPFEIQLLQLAPRVGASILMRGEFTDLKRFPPPLWKKIARTVFLRWVYRRVRAFGCVGEQAKAHLRRFSVPQERIFFSPYSVDSQNFLRQRQQFSREAARRELGLKPETFVFLFSGKLIPRKEILCLIRAFSHLPKDHNAALLILGDGELRKEVLQQGKEILQDRLLFQGFINQSQLGKYFAASDAFVLPSNYEAWGLVVNEAMLFGLPLILSHMIGSHRDLLVSNQTGYLFQAEDEYDLARAMKKMIQQPEHARYMGKQAEQRIQAYSTQKSTQGILEAIHQAPPL